MGEVKQDYLIEETANQIFADYCQLDRFKSYEQGEWQAALWKTLAESGLTAIDIPENLNGCGANSIDAFNFLRIAAYHSAPLPLADHFIACKILQAINSPISDGFITTSSSLHQELTITETNTGIKLNGFLRNIAAARHAKSIVVLLNYKQKKHALILDPGQGNLIHGQNMAGEPVDDMAIENLTINSSQLINGKGTLEDIHQLAALTRCVMCWGALARVLELSIAHATERTQFGRPIAKFQAVQQDIAKLAGEVAATHVTVDHAVGSYCAAGNSKHFSSLVAAAKVVSCRAAGFAATVSHQIHGAMGFTNEHPLHLFTRRLWTWREEYGNEYQWQQHLGQYLLRENYPSPWYWCSA